MKISLRILKLQSRYESVTDGLTDFELDLGGWWLSFLCNTLPYYGNSYVNLQ